MKSIFNFDHYDFNTSFLPVNTEKKSITHNQRKRRKASRRAPVKRSK